MDSHASFTVRTDWTPWPEDQDPISAAQQDPMATNDARESLFRLLQKVPTTAGVAPIPIEEGSRMAVDRDAAPNLINLPMACHTYLAGSADFLKGLYRMTRPAPNVLELPRMATYPLIRGVIESSAQAVWLLGPRERDVRLRRLLQIEKAEMDHDGRYVKVATMPHADDTHHQRSQIAKVAAASSRDRKTRWKRLSDAAAILNIPQAEFEHGVQGGWDAVIGQAIAQEYERDEGKDPGNDSHWQGRYSAGVWFFISGMSHPSMSRAWAGSHHELGDVGNDGLLSVKWSAEPSIIRDSLSLALRLHLRAIRLWAEASTEEIPAESQA